MSKPGHPLGEIKLVPPYLRAFNGIRITVGANEYWIYTESKYKHSVGNCYHTEHYQNIVTLAEPTLIEDWWEDIKAVPIAVITQEELREDTRYIFYLYSAHKE